MAYLKPLVRRPAYSRRRSSRSSVIGAVRSSRTLRGVDAETDRQLVRAVADGSAEALGRLYDRHADVVYGLARRILTRREDAEEVVQDVFAQVWRTAARYEARRATVAGWLVMLARTRAIDALRARQARPDQDRGLDHSAAPALASGGHDPDQVPLTLEEVRRVRSAVEALPDVQQVLIELAFFEGLTHSELAARTNTPLGTVKTRLRAAMNALRASLAGEADAVKEG